MTHEEQKKLIKELSDFRGSMVKEDLEKFQMMEKRDRDDEDLDALSRKVLEQLAARYVKRASKADIEERWKRITSGGQTKQ